MTYQLRNLTFNSNEIPFAMMTKGEAYIAALQMNQQARANLFTNRGNESVASIYQQEANVLQNLLVSGLHSNTGNSLNNLSTTSRYRNYIESAKSNTDSALKKDNKIVLQTVQNNLLLNMPNLPFDPTPEQQEECTRIAQEYIINKYGSFSIRDDNGRIGGQIYDEYRRFLDDCMKKLPYQNMLNEHVRQNGAVAMYSLFDEGKTRFNNTVGNKFDRGNRWIEEVNRVTGLDIATIKITIDTSIIENLKITPQEFQNRYHPYMQNLEFGGIVATQQEERPPLDLSTGQPVPDINISDDIVSTIQALIITTGTTIAKGLPVPWNAVVFISSYILAVLVKKWLEGNDKIRQREATFIEIAPGKLVPECSDLNGIFDNCVIPDSNGRCIVDGVEMDCSALVEQNGSGNSKGGNGLVYVLGIAALGIAFNRAS